ncbi:BTAD domain-containing putative transcriptional regulator [Nocardia sp. NPDC050408]|uniref:BTAD domain-containing putative transcriptional regulator n=1 Tax=unclassified Nocardia TaxID=2637762 RepID=UPI003428DF0D
MADTGVSFRVLGPLQLTIGDSTVELGTPKLRAVAAMLVLNRNRPVAIDALTSAAWEDCPPPKARASIHSYISDLRKIFADHGVDPRAALATAAPGYRLAVADADYDLARFTAAKTAGVKAAAVGQFEQASRHLTAALNEWHGPVLADLHEFQFVTTFATALDEDKLLAHTAYAEAEIAGGRAHEVIVELQTLTALYPYREPLWAQLITALYLAHRQADALDACRRLRTILEHDLGIDPGHTIRDLETRILRQQPLDVIQAAMTTATLHMKTLENRSAGQGGSTTAHLRDLTTGSDYPLRSASTKIGRLPDNDIVLDNAAISRHHAVVVDTGTSYIVCDLRSANGVHIHNQRIRGSAALTDGDRIRIGDHQLMFEASPN